MADRAAATIPRMAKRKAKAKVNPYQVSGISQQRQMEIRRAFPYALEKRWLTLAATFLVFDPDLTPEESARCRDALVAAGRSINLREEETGEISNEGIVKALLDALGQEAITRIMSQT